MQNTMCCLTIENKLQLCSPSFEPLYLALCSVNNYLKIPDLKTLRKFINKTCILEQVILNSPISKYPIIIDFVDIQKDYGDIYESIKSIQLTKS